MPRKATRNASGAGTIRRRSDGRWEARITIGKDPGSGKPIRKSIYGATQKEVRLKMQKAQVQVDEGSYSEPSRVRLDQWLETWISEYTSDVKDTTRTSYRQHIKNHIVPALGALKLSEISPVIVQTFINDLGRGNNPLSAKTIKNIHGVLHHALKRATILGYIRFNPAENITLPKIDKKDMKPLDVPEIKRLLGVLDAHDDIYSAIIKVDLFTGMRSGEILGLTWDCIDFERGTIEIKRQLRRPRLAGEPYRFSSLKNDKPRTMKPTRYVMDVLSQRRKRQLEDRLKSRDLWEADNGDVRNLVFTNEIGKYIDAAIVLRHLKKVLKEAGLEDRRFHDLRHTYAVSSLRAGDDVKTVQENLGHYTAAFTLDQYGHVTDTMRDASSKRMDEFIEGLK